MKTPRKPLGVHRYFTTEAICFAHLRPSVPVSDGPLTNNAFVGQRELRERRLRMARAALVLRRALTRLIIAIYRRCIPQELINSIPKWLSAVNGINENLILLTRDKCSRVAGRTRMSD